MSNRLFYALNLALLGFLIVFFAKLGETTGVLTEDSGKETLEKILTWIELILSPMTIGQRWIVLVTVLILFALGIAQTVFYFRRGGLIFPKRSPIWKILMGIFAFLFVLFAVFHRW